MSRFSLIILCGLLSALPAWSDTDLFEHPLSSIESDRAFISVADRLAAASRVRSDFRQVKTMKLLQRPLVSQGQMLFDKHYGLYWHIELPFSNTLVVTDNKILQRIDEQQRVVSAQQNPVAFGFSQVFFQVLSGDVAKMFEQFELFFVQTESGWRIGLIPREAFLSSVLAHIVLSGSQDLEQLTITDHAGDTTTVYFQNRTIKGSELTEQERAWFDF